MLRWSNRFIRRLSFSRERSSCLDDKSIEDKEIFIRHYIHVIVQPVAYR